MRVPFGNTREEGKFSRPSSPPSARSLVGKDFERGVQYLHLRHVSVLNIRVVAWDRHIFESPKFSVQALPFGEVVYKEFGRWILLHTFLNFIGSLEMALDLLSTVSFLVGQGISKLGGPGAREGESPSLVVFRCGTPLALLRVVICGDASLAKVTFLAISTDAPPAQIQLLNSSTLPPDLHVIHLPLVDVSNLLTAATGISVRIILVVLQTLSHLPSVLTNMQPPIQSLIVDPFCVGALEYASAFSIPTYLFLTTSASFTALTMYFPTLHAQVDGDYSKIAEKVVVPGCNPLLLDDLIVVRKRQPTASEK
ncbi:hypothetical protein L3X38_006790 [Prunus dulcis]|uniref:Uncharacterized protein n=1 Tax=Prunus dulcis TaxID=3755 RepID=A0AAD5F5A8_PRUDU|nr:hypothetical protein L3X38_006790 [Prunus dulcis]